MGGWEGKEQLGVHSIRWAFGDAVLSSQELSGQYIYNDGLKYEGPPEKWKYSTPSDRRFYSEVLDKRIAPAGESQLSKDTEPTPIPKGTYDAGDGYFSLETGTIHDYTSGEVVRKPEAAEREWIITKCRVGV